MATSPEQIRFHCPNCRRLMGIDPLMARRVTECPACQSALTVPEHSETPSSAGAPDWRSRLPGSAPADDSDGAFQLKRRRGEIDELDLTPMVDVTFLLLIFFMITASFSMQKSMEVPPPDPRSQGASPIPLKQLEENSVIVRVEPGDLYFVDGVAVENPDDLVLALSEAMASGNRSELVIEAADAARHGAVVRAYDAGNEVGMQRIRLANRVLN